MDEGSGSSTFESSIKSRSPNYGIFDKNQFINEWIFGCRIPQSPLPLDDDYEKPETRAVLIRYDFNKTDNNAPKTPEKKITNNEISPNSRKQVLCRYLKLIKPNEQKGLNSLRNRRSARVQNLQNEKNANLPLPPQEICKNISNFDEDIKELVDNQLRKVGRQYNSGDFVKLLKDRVKAAEKKKRIIGERKRINSLRSKGRLKDFSIDRLINKRTRTKFTKRVSKRVVSNHQTSTSSSSTSSTPEPPLQISPIPSTQILLETPKTTISASETIVFKSKTALLEYARKRKLILRKIDSSQVETESLTDTKAKRPWRRLNISKENKRRQSEEANKVKQREAKELMQKTKEVKEKKAREVKEKKTKEKESEGLKQKEIKEKKTKEVKEKKTKEVKEKETKEVEEKKAREVEDKESKILKQKEIKEVTSAKKATPPRETKSRISTPAHSIILGRSTPKRIDLSQPISITKDEGVDLKSFVDDMLEFNKLSEEHQKGLVEIYSVKPMAKILTQTNPEIDEEKLNEARRIYNDVFAISLKNSVKSDERVQCENGTVVVKFDKSVNVEKPIEVERVVREKRKTRRDDWLKKLLNLKTNPRDNPKSEESVQGENEKVVVSFDKNVESPETKPQVVREKRKTRRDDWLKKLLNVKVVRKEPKQKSLAKMKKAALLRSIKMKQKNNGENCGRRKFALKTETMKKKMRQKINGIRGEKTNEENVSPQNETETDLNIKNSEKVQDSEPPGHLGNVENSEKPNELKNPENSKNPENLQEEEIEIEENQENVVVMEHDYAGTCDEEDDDEESDSDYTTPIDEVKLCTTANNNVTIQPFDDKIKPTSLHRNLSNPKRIKPPIMKMNDENNHKKSSHAILLDDKNGAVLKVFYVDFNLVVTQEYGVSFWTQSALGNILGAQNMWIPNGNIQRLVLNKKYVQKDSMDMVISMENSVAYVELWTNEHKSDFREIPMADVFASVYFWRYRQIGLEKKLLQLENIKGFSDDVRFVVLKTAPKIIVSWHFITESTKTTNIRCYQLANDYQTVANILQMQSVMHYVSSLHIIEDCDNLIMGSGENKLTLWNSDYGYIVATINLSDFGSPINTFWAKCDRGFLFTLQEGVDQEISLLAINGLNHSWKKLQTYSPSTAFERLKSVFLESGILVGFYNQGVMCWNAQTGEPLVEEIPNETEYLPSGKFVIIKDNEQIIVKHALNHFITTDET